MRQNTFAESSFQKYHKKTRKEQFLEEMDEIIPWKELCAAIEPFYPKPAGAGRRPIGIERMLRIHFLQHWFNLSDPAAEEALYDSRAMRNFVGIDLGREPAPDETTICKFRHLMEKHNLGDELFRLVNEYLQDSGLKLSQGTIVDATIIHAPSSTKNALLDVVGFTGTDEPFSEELSALVADLVDDLRTETPAIQDNAAFTVSQLRERLGVCAVEGQ